MALHGTKALERWCQIVTEGYDGVRVLNMSTSWRSGLGFCALIHHFRPELIDFQALDPDDALANNRMAFDVAERHLGIPALLDAQDMVECELLDRLSILTYLSQFYQTFHGATTPAAGTAKTIQRSAAMTNSPTKSSLPMLGRRNEPCKLCSQPVFILERLNVGGRLLHRTCFKCARCGHQLNVHNYYETESGGYCCEMCPDEEKNLTDVVEANKKVMKLQSDSESSDGEDSAPESQRVEKESELDEEGNKMPVVTVTAPLRPPPPVITTTTTMEETTSNNNTDTAPAVTDSNANVSPEVRKKILIVEDEESEDEDEKPEAVKAEAAVVVVVPSSEDGNKSGHKIERVEDISDPDEEESNPFGDNGQDKVEVSADKMEESCEKVEGVEEKEQEEEEESSNPFGEDSDKEEEEEDKESGDKVEAVLKVEQDSTVKEEESSSNPFGGDDDDDEINIGANEEEEKQRSEGDKQSHIEGGKLYPSLDEVKEDARKSESNEEGASELMTSAVEKKTDSDAEKANEPKQLLATASIENADNEEEEKIYPDDLNPFGDEEVEQVEDKQDVSTNPFGDDFDENEEEDEVKPVPPKPPRASLNPFGDDFEDEEDEGFSTPHNLSSVSNTLRSPASPSLSLSAHRRKKRQAPKPPGAGVPPGLSPVPSPRTSLRGTTPTRRAPPRPGSPAPSTASTMSAKSTRPPRPPPPTSSTPLANKERKERDNLNRRSQAMMERPDSVSICSASSSATPSIVVLTPLSPDKAAVEGGQWRKKKGPAPPRPIPQKRQVKKLPRKAVNTELADIEIKQQGMERQGVRLEQSIRDLCIKSDRERTEKGLDNTDRDSLGPEVEDLIVQLFDLVNEKNDLYRRQTELMYMKRDHRLEEEHADIEHQIRLLMAKTDGQRTEEDKSKEEKLIARLMECVSQRNEIVDCLEMDRLRELEEDESFEMHMGEYAAIKPAEGEEGIQKKKKKEKKKKEKKKRKKDKNFDADKDIDTSECPSPKPSPKKTPSEKDKAKKFKKKIMASFSVATLKKAGASSSTLEKKKEGANEEVKE